MCAIPLNRAFQTFIQTNLRAPAQPRFGFIRRQVLGVNFALDFPLQHYARFDPAFFARQPDDAFDQIEDGRRLSRAEIERFAYHLVNLFRQQQVTARHVVNVDEFADGRAVAADDRRFVAQRRDDRARNDARQVNIAGAVNVRETRNYHGRPVGVSVGPRDDVRTGLRGVVREQSQQRAIFVVRQLIVRAVGFVARGDDHALDGLAAAAGFEQRIRAANVGLEGRKRRTVGGADDGLRGKMKDGLDLVLGHDALHQAVIFDRSVDDGDAAAQVEKVERIGAHGVALQTDYARALFDQRPRDVRADKPRGAGDESVAIFPE